MIAEEILKLQSEDYRNEEFLTKSELAERLKISESYLEHNGSNLPRVRIGNTYRYPINKVINFLNT